MNVDIANYLKSLIASEIYVDRIAGVVRAVVTMRPGQSNSEAEDDKLVLKSFPVSCDVPDEKCEDEGQLKSLMPNSKYKSVIYFEDLGVYPISTGDLERPSLYGFRSELKLVGWINGNAFKKTTCNLSSLFILNIISKFRKGKNNVGNYQRLSVNVIGEDAKSSAIFSRYSYNESYSQYLMPPYDYFALTIHTNFYMHSHCIDLLELNTDDTTCD